MKDGFFQINIDRYLFRVSMFWLLDRSSFNLNLNHPQQEFLDTTYHTSPEIYYRRTTQESDVTRPDDERLDETQLNDDRSVLYKY